MKNKIKAMTGKLHDLMHVAEECQVHCRDIGVETGPLKHTLIRIEILKVKTEHMRQIVHQIDTLRLSLLVVDDPQIDDVEAEVAAATAEAERVRDVAVGETNPDPDPVAA